MALGTDYSGQDCSLARALELVGERWTLLIIRDAFLGVRRFTDFEHHLDISKAVLADRLATLVEAGILDRTPRGRRDDYAMTDRGLALWPAVYALTRWGDAQTANGRPRRIFSHAACGIQLDASGYCDRCKVVPLPADIESRPAARRSGQRRTDPVAIELRERRHLLQPIGA